MIDKLALPEIRELLACDDITTLGEVLSDWLPADLAGVMGRLEDHEEERILRSLAPACRSQTFEYLDLATQRRLLGTLPEDESAQVLDGMAADDRTALLEELPGELAEHFLTLLSPAERDIARSLLRYGRESVGRLMTPDLIAIRMPWTLKHVLDHIRAHGRDSETLNVLYVVNDEGTLVDDLRIREILLAPLHAHVRDIVDGRFVALRATDDKKSAVEVFRKYDRVALPVIDDAGKLVGVVTIDDVLDVAEQEATRELQMFGGLEALDESYANTPLLAMVRKRATWLVILFISEMLTATAMGYFEEEIARAVVLALFVPLIISSGGNSGSQAATLIIRALALGEVHLHDWGGVLRRELVSGILLGALLGTIGFLRIAIWSSFSGLYGPHWPLVGVTVGASLVGIVLWGTLAGSMLPFILKRLGFDPATSSAPFVATLVDVTGLITASQWSYFEGRSCEERGGKTDEKLVANGQWPMLHA
jgi:magnesium transporter